MLAEAISELEAKLKAMEDELATIRHYVERMEQDNASMQTIIRNKNMQISGKANLLALFDAGFHVCSAHFGEMRDGECLFCASLLDKDALHNDEQK